MPLSFLYRSLIICLLIFSGLCSGAQNLVLNGDFEALDMCPYTNGTGVGFYTYWDESRESPDSFNSCANESDENHGVPENVSGYQYGFSGEGFIGALAYGAHSVSFVPDFREYAMDTLSGSLVPGMSYDVSFRVSLADNFRFGIDHLGLYFSTTYPEILWATHPIPNYAQFYTTEIVTDKENWTTISGSFIADSAYHFVSVGNFFADSLCNTIEVSPASSGQKFATYYYFDDISVIPSPDFIFMDADTLLCEGEMASFHAYGPFLGWALSSDPGTIISTDPQLVFTALEDVSYLAYYNSDTLEVAVQVVPFPSFELGSDTLLCEDEQLLLDVDFNYPVYYDWQDGYSGEEYTVTGPGTYSLKVWVNESCYSTDTIEVDYSYPSSVGLGPDVVLCEGDEMILVLAGSEGFEFQWWDGTTADSNMIDEPGLYWLESSFMQCSAVDTIVITGNVYPEIWLGNDSTLCEGQSFVIDLTGEALDFHWQDESTSSVYMINSPGEYYVDASNQGCITSDTLQVFDFPEDIVEFIEADTLCEGEILILSIPQTIYSITWQDNSSQNIYEVEESGDYWATVQYEECISTDTISIFFQPFATVDLGNDTSICIGTTLTLDAGNEGYSSLWQDNSTNQQYEATTEGTYNVEVSLNDCTSEDEIVINYYPQQTFSLPQNNTLCEQTTTTLSIEGDWQSILWSTGETTEEITVDTTGIFWATAQDNCTTQSDTIRLTPGYCNCQLYLPYVLNTNTLGAEQVNTTQFTCPVTDFGMKIYDPIGRLVAETTEIDWQWDPHANIAFGVYVFSIRYRFEHETEMRYLTQKVLVAERIRN